jgi:two-component system chemotaxis response regulator CheY
MSREAWRILIVDDSPALRAFIRRALEISGIDTSRSRQAANGEEALAQLDREPADLILTDVNMPVLDGEGFLRRLRQLPAHARTPVIVVSTDATHRRVEDLLALGAKGYITKPFAPERLRTELERVLGAAPSGGGQACERT